jgi:putative membrane protein
MPTGDERSSAASAGGLGDLEPRLEDRNPDELSFLLSSRRTRLSIQRTRMSADRTLMSIIRTALSLIGFGFTIFQFFRNVRESAATRAVVGAAAARNFGAALVLLGLLILTLGIFSHLRFMWELRLEHRLLVEERLVPSDRLPYSVTLAVALLLWTLGLLAIIGMMTRLAPLGS